MTWGHTSSHKETTTSPAGDVRQRVLASLKALNWQVTEEGAARVTARVPTSIWSFGEDFSVEFIEGGGLRVMSTSRLSTTLVDWGKNKRNAHAFIVSLHDQAA